MKISRRWLQELVDARQSDRELAHLLTMGGLEVEAIDAVAPPFARVVVAEVLSCEPHPQADRLKLCRVRADADPNATPLQIVCGAPNVVAGCRVPCALVGANLPGMEIREAKVRGIASQGMLCSARELGIADDASGLLLLPADAPVGQSIRTYLELDDSVFTLKLTPNRGDCLSRKGLAREVAAITGARLELPPIPAVPAASSLLAPGALAGAGIFPAALGAGDACPIYLGRVIRLASRPAESPAWLRRRLERSGLRPIEPVVDATNYGLLALGQPTHAFDHHQLHGRIQVRLAAADGSETLTLLNGETVQLRPDTLLVADDRGPLALAGVMGGAPSSVTAATTEVFLECAWFAPAAVAGRSRQYTLNSEAAHRFERGVDPAGVFDAIEFVTRVLLELCGGEAGPVVVSGTLPAERAAVAVRLARVNRVLGLEFDATSVAALLTRLDVAFTESAGVFLVQPPTHRFDLAIEADFIEEVARLHGYDAIPGRMPAGRLGLALAPEARRVPLALARQLVARDYQEIITYSFVDPAWERDFAANHTPVGVINPIAAHMAVMRSTLAGGLIATLSANLKRRADRVRLFEIGRTFAHVAAEDAGDHGLPYRQPLRLGLLAYGLVQPEQWGAASRRVDYYDLKSEVERLDETLRFEAAAHPALHPGRSAAILQRDRAVGWIGELHPALLAAYDLPNPPMLCEIDVDALRVLGIPQFTEPSRFPPVRRDISVLVADAIPVQALLDALERERPEQVVDIGLFDLYRGEGLPEGQKSLAFRIVIQDTARTLTEAEIDAVILGMTQILAKHFNAELRK